MFGLTRPQLAYRLKRLQESGQGAPDISPAPTADPSRAQA